MRAAAVSALLLAAATASVQDDGSPEARGRRLFEARGCYGCHAIGGVGATTGPSLSRVGPSTRASIWRAGSARRHRAGAVQHTPKIPLAEPELEVLTAHLSSLREF